MILTTGHAFFVYRKVQCSTLESCERGVTPLHLTGFMQMTRTKKKQLQLVAIGLLLGAAIESQTGFIAKAIGSKIKVGG